MRNINDTQNNKFKIGDKVKVYSLCDSYGNELDKYDNRYEDLFKEGEIDRVFGSDLTGGYIYSIEGAKYSFNKYELIHLE